MEKLNGKKLVLFVFAAWFAYFTAYLGRYSYSSNLVAIESAYNIDKGSLGLVSTLLFFSYGGGQFVSGMLSKRFNSIYLVLIGLISSVICNALVPLCLDDAFFMVKYLWVINGFAQSLLWCNIVKLISIYVPGNSLSNVLIIMTASVTLGTFGIYGISALFMELNAFKLSFVFASILMFIAASVWIVVMLWSTRGKKVDVKAKEKVVLEYAPVKNAPFYIFLVSLMMAAVAGGFIRDGIQTWFPTILENTFGLKGSFSVLLSLTLPLVSFIGVVFGQKITDHMKKPAISSGVALIVSGAMVLIVSLTLDLKILTLFIVCFAITVMLMNIVVHNSTGVMPFNMSNYMHVGMISGVLDAFIYLGSGIATYTLGALSETYGWGGVMTVIYIVGFIIGVLALISAFMSVKLKPRNPLDNMK